MVDNCGVISGELPPAIEPPPNTWQFPPPAAADGEGFVAVGADLEPGTLLAAYSRGLFPMPFRGRSAGDSQIGWWSPDPRGILPLDGQIASRSLRASRRRFETRLDTSFTEVMTRCGDPSRPHGWINNEFIDAYSRLHALGWAHSIEIWRDDNLVGGLYGVRIGGFFAGESKFHTETDASKVAVVETVEWLRATGGKLFDVQWCTPHLATLGAVEISRESYLRQLSAAIG